MKNKRQFRKIRISPEGAVIHSFNGKYRKTSILSRIELVQEGDPQLCRARKGG
jgi:hypothetical protein